MREPRCLVCGSPLGFSSQFEKDVRKSEVCSDRCYKLYICRNDDGPCVDCDKCSIRECPLSEEIGGNHESE
jgi:hypothetical protein